MPRLPSRKPLGFRTERAGRAAGPYEVVVLVLYETLVDPSSVNGSRALPNRTAPAPASRPRW